MFTYQDKKVAALTLLTLMFWLVVLMLRFDVDKEKVQAEVVIPEAISLEPVRGPVIVECYPLEEEIVEEVVLEEPTQEVVEVVNQYPEFTYSKDWSVEDSYLLAKIAMAEAEGESMKGKTLVIMSVLNRVWDDEFPDTIEEVILQEDNGVYQYSPVIPGGRWWTTEPNEDCWEAVRIVQEAVYDYSEGALYFEACENENNWHSRNLEFLYQEGNHRFYK